MLDEESLRGERLDKALGLLTAFVGLILALTAPGVGFIEGTTGVFLDVFHVGSIVLLAASAALTISVLFRSRTISLGGEEVTAPWRRVVPGDDILDRLQGAHAAESPAAVERRMTASLVDGIRDQRDLNLRRWGVLRLAGLAAGLALLMLAAQGVIAVFAW